MHQTKSKDFEQLLETRPFCERQSLLNDHQCKGRSTMEHCLMYAGKQIPDAWAVIRLCEYAHGVGRFPVQNILNKEINEWIALNHATEMDLAKYPRVDWEHRKNYLNKKYVGSLYISN